MDTKIVFTLTGPDRIGIVEEVTRLLLNRGGNVEASRMARLSSEFAILMLVSIPSEQLPGLEMDLQALIAQGYKVTTTQASQTFAQAHPAWLPYQIEVRGADHEGIVHEIAGYLRQRGINIESMDMEVVHAPVSGSPLFTMKGLVAVPPSLAGQPWEAALDDVGNRLNVDITVTAAMRS
ncbi:MAG: transcriptional regulator [Chloroflexi bacterium]|nr:transcriptional regulator [Chloroflexota bacterium]MCL5275942.1 transcriptional regulator [Chloroflexota bacterium]